MQAVKKDTIREIKRTFNRFISILVIVGMGAGFFVGVKATAPSMMQTAEDYYNAYNLMDLKILSTFGFGDDDIQKLEQVKGVEKIYPSYSADLMLQEEDGSPVVRTMSIEKADIDGEEINKPELLEGRMPEQANECVIESSKFIDMGYEIGDKLTFSETTGDTEVSDILKNREFTVVGKVKSPIYISYDHGTTYVGDGSISAFVMLPEENFLYSRYTEVYIVCEKGESSCFSKEYDKKTQEVSEKISVLGESQYKVFKNDTMQEIESAEEELNEKKEDAQQKLEDAKNQLDEARSKIQAAVSELEVGKQELSANEKMTAEKLAKGEEEINSAMAQLQESYKQLQAAEEEYNRGKAKFESETSAARKELDDGWAQYNAGVHELESRSAQLEDAKKQVDDGWGQYYQGEQQLNEGKEQLEQGKSQVAQLQSSVDELTGYRDSIQNIIDEKLAGGESESSVAFYRAILGQVDQQLSTLQPQLDDANAQVAEGEAKINASEAELAASKQQLEAAQAQIDAGEAEIAAATEQLNASKQQLEEGEAQYVTETEAGRQQLEDGYNKYQAGKEEYESGMQKASEGQAELAESRKKAEAELASGREKIQSGEEEVIQGKKELTENEKKYEDAVKDAEDKIRDGDMRIQDAKKSIGEIEAGIWYVFERKDNPGYSGFSDDAARTDAMAGIFPVFFLLVAVLVCLTTMTRMVEEQRGQIGTLKALGYSNRQIAGKYFTYSSLAGVMGSGLGIILGVKFLPKAIIGAYSAMYALPELEIIIPWGSAVGAFIVSVFCTTSVALFTCYKELKVRPAQLMRPKAPKEGKRILMERIRPLWKRLSFSHKVTARNLFRYKGRLIMTVIGIAGCTALIMAALGLQDAISVIVPRQFEDIYNYDTIISLRSAQTEGEMKKTLEKLEVTGQFDNYMSAMQEAVKVNTYDQGESMEVYLYVPESPKQLADFISLHKRDSKNIDTLDDNGVVITEKMAAALNLKVGDPITFISEDIPYTVTVEGITENYVYHYIYMTSGLYGKTLGKEVEYNVIVARMQGTGKAEQKALSEKLLKNSEFTSIIYTDSVINNFSDQIKGLDAVVYIMILAAGALAFVVLYNLTNINISERIREVATIKVLGFYNREVNMYVFRENIVMTLIGIVSGLVLGFIISGFMVRTIEMDMVMFGREIQISSFIISSVLTIGFTLLVNGLMSGKMKRISMVESLKSVE